MDVQLHPLIGLSPAVLRQWADLASRPLEPNPYVEPGFTLAAVRAVVRDDETPMLAAVSDGDDLVACLPVVTVARWHRVVWPSLVTWTHDYCLLGTPLVDRDVNRARDALAALLTFRFPGTRPPFLVLERMRGDGPVAGAIEAALAVARRHSIVYERFERPSMETAPLPPGTHARRLRRARRRLAELAGGPVGVRDVAADPDAVARFLDLEAAGWKGRDGTALARRPGHADMFRAVADEFSAAGRLRMEEVAAGDKTIAMLCGFRAADGELWFKMAYDERFAAASPGVQVVVAAAGRARGWVDSCASPPTEWLEQLLPDRRAICTIVVAPPGVTGTVLAGAVRASLALREWRRRRTHVAARTPR